MALDRRALLRGAGLGTLTLAGALAGGFKLSLAAGATDQRLLLVVLRGAMDGLAAVPPYGDRDYRAVRGQLALGEPLDLDGFYGLHPALAAIAPWYRAGELMAVHAVATPYRERSHFDAQDLLDNGTVRPHGSSDGWLNRTLALLGAGDRRLGLAIGRTVPLVLRGAVPVASWAPSAMPQASPDFLGLVGMLYRGDPLLEPAYLTALDAGAMADQALGDAAMTGQGNYRRVAAELAEAAGRLLAASDGPRIGVIELPGWDTHAGQGAETGRLATALTMLGESLAGFRQALGAAWRSTAVVVVTEFGRTATRNGTGGTDHGTATAVLLAGGAIAGGRVAGDWPGLGRLYQDRDLAPTTDLRAILKGVLAEHLAVPADALDRVVFPESAGVAPMRGLVRI